MPRTTTRIAFLSDTHGESGDIDAIKFALSVVADFKPDIRIAGGDHFNFDAMRQRADEDDRLRPVYDDIERGREFIEAYKPTHYIMGNHDNRLVRWAKARDGIKQFIGQMVLRALQESLGDTPMLDYHVGTDELVFGDTTYIHGYHAGDNALRNAAMTFGKVVMGHVHSVEHVAVKRSDRAVGYSCGCLCDLYMDYSKHQPGTLRHRHGFVLAEMDSHGRTEVCQPHAVSGHWTVPIPNSARRTSVRHRKPSQVLDLSEIMPSDGRRQNGGEPGGLMKRQRGASADEPLTTRRWNKAGSRRAAGPARVPHAGAGKTTGKPSASKKR